MELKAAWSFHSHVRQHTRCCYIAVVSFLGWLLFLISFISQIKKGQTPPLLVLFSDIPPSEFRTQTQQRLTINEQNRHQISLHDDQQLYSRVEKNQPPAPHDFNLGSSAIMESPLMPEETRSELLVKNAAVNDSCSGRYIYMYELPRKFNEDLIGNCSKLSIWTDMCKDLLNGGFGPAMEELDHRVFPKKGSWYATNQFSLEVIFHNRMKRYRCLTPDYSLATAFFIPFYAGMDFSRYLYGFNTSVRDADSKAIASWLRDQPGWKVRTGGRTRHADHFMVGGRITWDFRRAGDGDDEWGNKLLFLPGFKDITMLVLEASPWFPNDVGIPYPTYFHPKHDSEIVYWQKRVRRANRTSSLFSFAGAPRPQIDGSIRENIIQQCERSEYCRLLEECDYGLLNCRNPAAVMRFFEESVFCLQPPGDSLTRRSIFDSMLAGCIPVFFHEESAYSQYVWHLPAHNHTKYSVFISIDEVRRETMIIEKVLRQITPEQIRSMREEVINLIPGFIYAHPKHHLRTMRDAFHITVQAVLDKAKAKRNLSNAKETEI